MPFKKGKGGRVARALKAKEPKLIEGPKQLLCIKGPATSQLVVDALKDLVSEGVAGAEGRVERGLLRGLGALGQSLRSSSSNSRGIDAAEQ